MMLIMITNLSKYAILNLFKDSLNFNWFAFCNVLSKLEIILIAIIMIPLASICCKTLGKRIGKVSTQANERTGILTTILVELFKNHKLIKFFKKKIMKK